MKGIIFIFLIYLVIVLASIGVKYLSNNVSKNKSRQPPASKIYYITNTAKKKPPKKVDPDIAIKGSIIEKREDF